MPQLRIAVDTDSINVQEISHPKRTESDSNAKSAKLKLPAVALQRDGKCALFCGSGGVEPDPEKRRTFSRK